MSKPDMTPTPSPAEHECKPSKEQIIEFANHCSDNGICDIDYEPCLKENCAHAIRSVERKLRNTRIPKANGEKMYAITEDELSRIESGCTNEYGELARCVTEEAFATIRSRPISDAKAPESEDPEYWKCPFSDCKDNEPYMCDWPCKRWADWHDSAVRKAEREAVLKEFTWMKPLCFGRYDAICDTRCAWIIRQRCSEFLRGNP